MPLMKGKHGALQPARWISGGKLGRCRFSPNVIKKRGEIVPFITEAPEHVIHSDIQRVHEVMRKCSARMEPIDSEWGVGVTHLWAAGCRCAGCRTKRIPLYSDTHNFPSCSRRPADSHRSPPNTRLHLERERE